MSVCTSPVPGALLRTLAALAVATLAAPNAVAEAPALPYSGTPIDVLTYHYDNARTGGDRDEADLDVASVSSARFGRLHTIAVNGDVLAQPLLVSRMHFPDDSVHDVLVVATETNDVYAIDANTYHRFWHVNLGKPQDSADLKCSRVEKRPYGVSATPVIARRGAGSATLYLVASTAGGDGRFRTMLHALDLSDGHDAHAPVEIAAQARLEGGSIARYASRHQFVRAGLAYQDGGIYFGTTTRCEPNVEDEVTGWLLRYDENLRQTGAFNTVMKAGGGLKLASVWAAGFAPAIDHDGTVYAVTGNGNFSHGGQDWGESVLRLDRGLGHVEDYFTPAAYRKLNQGDVDFGAGGVLLIPTRDKQAAPPLAVAMGKSHVLYLLDRTRLGHVHDGDSGALEHRQFPGDGIWGGPSYWDGPHGGRVYYQAKDDVLRAYAVDTGAHPSLSPVDKGTEVADNSLPVVSSHGSDAGTGVVWTINSRLLRAYDAQTLGKPIFETDIPRWRGGSAYLTPLVANGRVYVGSSNAVAVYGLGR